MSDRNVGQEILEGIKEIKRFKKGEIKLKARTLKHPSPTKAIRKRLNKIDPGSVFRVKCKLCGLFFTPRSSRHNTTKICSECKQRIYA